MSSVNKNNFVSSLSGVCTFYFLFISYWYPNKWSYYDDMSIKARGLGEKEDRSERSTEEQGDATQTFRLSGNNGSERRNSIWEDCRQNCFQGKSTFQLLQEGDEGIQEKKVERQFWWIMNFRGHDSFRNWRRVLKGAGLGMYRPFDLSVGADLGIRRFLW